MTTPKRDEVEAVALEALKEAMGSIQALSRDGNETYKRRVIKESLASVAKLELAIDALDESRARDKGDGK